MSLPESRYIAADWPSRPADRHPDTLEWVARIEAVRRNVELPTTRRCCGPCGRVLPLTESFARKRSEVGGRHYVCRTCDADRKRRDRAERKRSAFRAILEQAS